jgi:hypothetical protein
LPLPARRLRNHHCACRFSLRKRRQPRKALGGANMNGLIYLIGLIVVIMAILSFFGLR